MYNSRYARKSPSESSATSNRRSPVPSDYEYLGRLVTRERPVVHKSRSVQHDHHFLPNRNQYQYSMGSHDRERYRTVGESSSADDTDDLDGLSKPLGVIRISDRHYREIYRLPTPPPKVKRVFHRLQSPEPKIIERVYVRRPPPQIIENVIEVPPEKVRIIKREKFLDNSAPVTRSKLVHLKSRHQQANEQQQQQYEESYAPSEQYSQQQTTTVPDTTTTATKLVYPPQPNMRTVGYVTSTVPPEVMFNSQEPIQIPMSQTTNPQMIQPTPYDNPPLLPPPPQQQQPMTQQMIPQQIPAYQMMPVTSFNLPQQPIQPVSQQTTTFQMAPSNTFNFPPQTGFHQPMMQPTPFTFPSQQIMPQPPYGFAQFP